jgi:hypothetical protein
MILFRHLPYMSQQFLNPRKQSYISLNSSWGQYIICPFNCSLIYNSAYLIKSPKEDESPVSLIWCVIGKPVWSNWTMLCTKVERLTEVCCHPRCQNATERPTSAFRKPVSLCLSQKSSQIRMGGEVGGGGGRWLQCNGSKRMCCQLAKSSAALL